MTRQLARFSGSEAPTAAAMARSWAELERSAGVTLCGRVTIVGAAHHEGVVPCPDCRAIGKRIVRDARMLADLEARADRERNVTRSEAARRRAVAAAKAAVAPP